MNRMEDDERIQAIVAEGTFKLVKDDIVFVELVQLGSNMIVDVVYCNRFSYVRKGKERKGKNRIE